MFARLSRTVLFGAYQLSIAIAILLMPIAIVARRVGIPVPMHRPLRALEDAYDRIDE